MAPKLSSPQQKKLGLSGLVIWLLVLIVIGIALVIVVLSVQQRAPRSGAATFVETFDNLNFYDPATTADWNTTQGVLQLLPYCYNGADEDTHHESEEEQTVEDNALHASSLGLSSASGSLSSSSTDTDNDHEDHDGDGDEDDHDHDADDNDQNQCTGCAECDGKVTNLTLQYNGSAGVQVRVEQKKDNVVVFDQQVAPGEQFSFTGTDKSTLGTEISIFEDNVLNTKLHTSCSQPIGPGTVSGDFTVVAGDSKNGGALCAIGQIYHSPGHGLSTDVYSGSGNITKVTLTANDSGASCGTIEYAVTANGQDYYTVTSGVPFVFPQAGNDLRWRARLTSDADLSCTPIVYDITLDYTEQPPVAPPSLVTMRAYLDNATVDQEYGPQVSEGSTFVGAHFKIVDNATATEINYTAANCSNQNMLDADGRATCDLVPGTYTVTLLDLPTGAVGPFVEPHNATGSNPVTVTFTGTPTGDIVDFGFTPNPPPGPAPQKLTVQAFLDANQDTDYQASEGVSFANSPVKITNQSTSLEIDYVNLCDTAASQLDGQGHMECNVDPGTYVVELLGTAPAGASGPFKSTFNVPGINPLNKTLVGDPLQDVAEFGYTTRTIITECGGDTAVAGAVDCSKKFFPDPKKAKGVCFARDDLFFDIFTATPLCRFLGYSLLVTPTAELADATRQEIVRLQAGRGSQDFGVLGFGREVAVSEKVFDAIRLLGLDPRRIGGLRRENTAFLSSTELAKSVQGITELSLNDNVLGVDVLAFAPVAGAGSPANNNQFMPTLLTWRTGTGPKPAIVHDTVITFLLAHPEITNVNISGGPAAVPFSVDDQIKQLFPQVKVTRYNGDDRFETAKIINEHFFPTPQAVVGAMGRPQNIAAASARKERHGPDHYALLWAAYLAANLDNAALQMFDTNSIPGPTSAYVTAHKTTIQTAWIVGSLEQVSQLTRNTFYDLLN